MSEERTPLVGIVMCSDSDLPVMRKAADILKTFDVPFEIRVMSAHRTPELAHDYATTAHERGLKVLIAGAPSARVPAVGSLGLFQCVFCAITTGPGLTRRFRLGGRRARSVVRKSLFAPRSSPLERDVSQNVLA